ncbi:MAG: flavin reductase family protein [Syntrophobacterales bacterium]|nr:flavin reductase family protein [Syntrophobacterales bacterium]
MNKKAFYTISYGIYIVASGKDGKFNGQIANTVFQVTSEPATVAVSINKQNYTHELITASGKFTVSALDEEAPMTMIGRFGFKSGKEIDKFEGIGIKTGATGIPVVTEHAVAFIEAEVIGSMDCGTHTIFLGNVSESDVLSSAAPMTYAYYQKIKGGKAPKTAPTYQAP